MPISTPRKKQDSDLGFAVLAFVLAGKWFGLREEFLLELIQPFFPAVGLDALRREIARLEAHDLVEVEDSGAGYRRIKGKGWMA